MIPNTAGRIPNSTILRSLQRRRRLQSKKIGQRRPRFANLTPFRPVPSKLHSAVAETELKSTKKFSEERIAWKFLTSLKVVSVKTNFIISFVKLPCTFGFQIPFKMLTLHFQMFRSVHFIYKFNTFCLLFSLDERLPGETKFSFFLNIYAGKDATIMLCNHTKMFRLLCHTKHELFR